jgi:transcriptional regulator with XRE-family HTH domain
MTQLGVAPEMERKGMTSDYVRALGARLRAIRTQQGLSLHGVEKKSKGRWKAVVVGSYERGDRAVTVQKLAELADFYGVPVGELLPEGRTASSAAPAQKIVLNLERLFQLPPDQVGPLARYAQAIQSQRGDYNNKVLSIRGEDLRSLSIIYDLSEGELTERLIEWGVLAPDARSIDPALDRRSEDRRSEDRRSEDRRSADRA